jgi:hypothetical protein
MCGNCRRKLIKVKRTDTELKKAADFFPHLAILNTDAISASKKKVLQRKYNS